MRAIRAGWMVPALLNLNRMQYSVQRSAIGAGADRGPIVPPRIEFSEATKRVIGERVNYLCSSPSCGVGTLGPRSEPGKSVKLGVAAHITAAASGGPRYEATLTDEQRASAENGIWLCQNCAKLIDNDAPRFPTDLLKHWKFSAEKIAEGSIGKIALFSRLSAPPIVSHENPKPRGDSLDPRAILEETPPSDANVLLLASGNTALGSPFAVVGIGTNHDWHWQVQYLVRSEVGWLTMATIQFDGQKGHPPEVQYVAGTPGALFINYAGATGSGVFHRQATLYRIARNDAEAIMTFPTQFYVVGWGMPFDRHLSAKDVVLPAALDDGAEFHLSYDLGYEISAMETGGQAEPLIHYAYNFDLIWNDEFGQFTPKTAYDDLSILDMAWNEDTGMFVARCRGELAPLGTYGTAAQKQFVAKYVA